MHMHVNSVKFTIFKPRVIPLSAISFFDKSKEKSLNLATPFFIPMRRDHVPFP